MKFPKIHYHFNQYIFDPEEYLLLKDKKPVKLRPKTCRVLQKLVENSGHVVTKEELLDSVWGNVIVTESNLTQCIKELRAILEDNAQRPVYIQTITGIGYKFIAEVQIEQSTELEFTGNLTGKIRPKKAVGISSFVLILVTGLGFLMFVLLGQRNSWFLPRDWLLIGDFQNKTSHSELAEAIRLALERELSKSNYVNIVPRGRIIDVLKLMKSNPDTFITPQIGFEICRRDGNIQLFIDGVLLQVGEKYSLSLRMFDPSDGRLVRSYGQSVESETGLLEAVHQLARQVREDLGESIREINRSGGKLARVTTSSLQALAWYSRGWQKVNNFDWHQADLMMRQALILDSSFAMAHLLQGYAKLWLGKTKTGLAHFRRAAQLSDGLSAREKYFILGTYQTFCLQNSEKAIESYEILLQLYPDDYWAHENLALLYLYKRDFPKWWLHKQACMRIRPHYPVNYSDIGIYYLFLKGDIEGAYKHFNRAYQLDKEFPFEFVQLADGLYLWMRDDLIHADEIFQKYLKNRQNRVLSQFQVTGNWYIAHFYLFQGKINRALQLLENALHKARSESDGSLVNWCKIELALTYLQLNKMGRFFNLLNEVGDSAQGMAKIEALGWMAFQYARIGNLVQAGKLLNQITTLTMVEETNVLHFPLQSEMQRAKSAFWNLVKGEMTLQRGDTSLAVAHFLKLLEIVGPDQLPLQSAVKPNLYMQANLTLAKIFINLGQIEKSLSFLNNNVQHKTLMITVPGGVFYWLKSRRLLENRALDNKYREYLP